MLPLLVSSKTCPFVQRAVILLEEKQVEHEVKYVDLADKPQWFLDKSPRGKVPLLIVDGVTLFESQAICEYLDETSGDQRLAPEDPVLRARDRAWFPFAGEDLFGSVFRVMTSTTEAQFDSERQELGVRLSRLAQEKTGRWLSGDGSRFGLADVAVAPVFTRLAFFDRLTHTSWLEGMPELAEYAKRLLARPAMLRSVPEDFETALRRLLGQKKSWMLAHYG
jgi:glutathione S-transferase